MSFKSFLTDLVQPRPEYEDLVLIFMLAGHYDKEKKLSPLGLEQVSEVGARLANTYTIDKIIASGDPAAMHSAQIVAEFLKEKEAQGPFEIERDDALNIQGHNSPVFLRKSLPNVGQAFRTVLCVTHYDTALENIKRFSGIDVPVYTKQAVYPGNAIVSRFNAPKWSKANFNTFDFSRGLLLVKPENGL
ncbi:MAG: histidine phosphatase family protein [Alphaproteobacteria bacterium]|nr:histidine phosphatase family protein [Alphaproteobacteria bacterium]